MKKKVYLRYMSNTNNQYIYDDASGNIFQWNNLYEEIINMYCEHNLTTITENLLGKYNIDEIQETLKIYLEMNLLIYRGDKFCFLDYTIMYIRLEEAIVCYTILPIINGIC